jgi:FkbH-like protein
MFPSSMKLREALELIRQARPAGAEQARYLLGCSTTSTHLQTFLQAYLLRQRPELAIEIEAILYGDLLGSLERIQPQGYTGVTVVCEWYDLDPRLGFRRLGGWAPSVFGDIIGGVRAGLGRLQNAIEKISAVVPVVVALPTLPLPPLEISVPAQTVGFEAEVWSPTWEFARWCGSRSGVRLLSPAELDLKSPSSVRFDLRTELSQGCPYQVAHISALAELMSRLLAPATALKGLITDLDDTLWEGILGEVGVSGVGFTLEAGAQIHGLYQQFLQSLAERGVLIGIASKNDSALAEQALARTDLLVRRASFFPAEIHWQPKSASVGRILKRWNVGPEAVAFVDDSPLEVAEVQAHFPTIRCLVFPGKDPARLLEFFATLREWFGKPKIRDEDRIRARSLQRNATMHDERYDPALQEAFLAGIEARLSFQLSRNGNDERAFELVNKTNQFNLNGRRIPEVRWVDMLAQRESFLLTVAYSDKFGPMGKIVALLGRRVGREATVSTWVMSCRAFSRRIEHATLRYLFERLEVDRIAFEFEATERNIPLQEFFAELGIPKSAPILTRKDFDSRCPSLPHALEEVPAHV